MSSQEIYVTSQELERVYTPLRDWLTDYGSLEADDGREITGTHLGLPIAEGFAPDYCFILDPVKAVQYAPIFAKAFEIGPKEIELSFFPPCWFTNDFTTATAELIKQGSAPLQYDAGGLRMYIRNTINSPYNSKILRINPHDETFLIDRMNELRIPGRPGVKHQEEYFGVNPGEPNSVNHKEYLGLVALADMLYIHGPVELQHTSGWEQHLPDDFRPN